MAEHALAHPVMRDKIEDYRKIAAEMEGSRHEAHRGFLLSRGIHAERVFLQRMPEGPAWALLHWQCDDPEAVMSRGMEDSEHGRFIRERILGEMAGIPVDADMDAMPANELVADVEGLPGGSLATYMFALPIVPGQEETFLETTREVTTGALRGELEQLLRDAGIHRERTWLQPAPEGADAPWLAIVVRDTDDPYHANEVILRSGQPLARRFQEQILPEIHGLDFTSGLPRLNELVSATHVRRSDAPRLSTDALLRRGYSAFSRADFETLAEVMAPDVTWIQVGQHPLAGTYRGREETFRHFSRLAEETTGSLSVEIERICGDGDFAVVIQHNRARRKGRELDHRTAVHFTIIDGQVAVARSVPLEDPGTVDAFWS